MKSIKPKAKFPISNVDILIPYKGHCGSFGAIRKFDIHTGIDIYAPIDTEVHSCEDGIYIGCFQFTGKAVGSPWWNNTYATVIKHKDFIGIYGEISPIYHLIRNEEIKCGDLVGKIIPVLKVNKGKPMNMLHFEMYKHEAIINNPFEFIDWNIGQKKPDNLLDPTEYLNKLL